MKIGEVIRTCRKSRNLTQEEMARRLGVTAPAVNKWENNVSLPDITLLAPIARLLETTPDELLSFREQLTQEEVNAIVKELDEKFQETSYKEGFEFARKKIRQYPSCHRLSVHLAMVLDGWRIWKQIPDSEQMKACEKEILEWYRSALESEEAEVRELAADALFSYYYRSEEYEEAEKYLEYFSRLDPGKKIHKALLLEKKGDREGSWKTYEELLFQTNNVAEAVLGGMMFLAGKENDGKKARMLCEKMITLAKLFETGKYHELSAELQLAQLDKDKKKTEECVERLIKAVDQLDSYRYSPLYAHMNFGEVQPEFLEQLKTTLRESYEKDPEFAYMRE